MGLYRAEKHRVAAAPRGQGLGALFGADDDRLFPFLSYDEIRYALKRLVKGRALTKGRFNESRFDRTNWYAFTEFGQFLMAESEVKTQ